MKEVVGGMEALIASFAALLLFVFMLYLSSAMEVAVFSLELDDEQKLSGSRRWLAKALKRPGDLEAFFIVARALSLGGFAIAIHIYFGALGMTSHLLRYLLEGGIFCATAMLAMNILPASAVAWSAQRTFKLSGLVRFLYVVLYPVKQVAKVALNLILKNIGLEGLQSIAAQRRLAYITDEGGHAIESEERQMIRHIMDFVETTVREVMVPRVDIVCAPVDSTVEDIIELVEKHGHSRIPLYDETIDNIVGILYTKDLLLALGKGERDIDLSRICRKPYFVPESKLIDSLLEEFKREKLHIAIVVDEYGGVAGLVTMEDLLEEIVGEIQDEYDTEEAPIQRIGEGVWRVYGRVTLDEVSEEIGVELPGDEADTIGGLVYQLAGAIPEPGFQVEVGEDILLVVEKIDGQRIKTVKVVRKGK